MINTNYSTNVEGALKLIQINGKNYQLGKDADNTNGGITKLFNTLETYKAATDGAYNAKVVYDELQAIKDSIGGDGETSLSSQIDDINDTIGTIESGHTVAGDIAALETRMDDAEGDIDDLQSDVTTLKAGASTQGSVAYQIAQIVNENNNGSIDTLNEIAAWIVNDTTGAAKMASDISALQTAIGAVDYSGKADKVASATSGNFAGLDANGNLTDSGKKASDFVAAESGKRLMTDAEGTKLAGIATGAEVNVLEGITIANGSATAAGDVTLSSKKATISIPSNTSHLTNDSNFAVDASYVHTDNNYTTAEKNKLAAISASVSGDTLAIVTQAAA